MAVSHLQCKECRAEYPLEALYVCERCFGPLEVAYDHSRSSRDVGELRRRIQGGPQNIWRYADFLPLAGGPPGPSGRLASRVGLPAGCTPLIRADRLAARLGLREVWVKNDAANPTHSFKDRVVSVAVSRARELGFETIACASTGNLANSVAAHGAALGLESYVFIPADLEEQKILATGVYGTRLVGVQGSYDDVNRLCTELCAERDWAFVNINLRPYYAEG
ncbi:MAG: pyridoxal-phosphate dependent enzyme, partial [Solirubrobacteraceae bacterium]